MNLIRKLFGFWKFHNQENADIERKKDNLAIEMSGIYDC